MKNTHTGTPTASSRLSCVFFFPLSPGKVLTQSYWVHTHTHTALSLVCTYCIVDISDCFPVVLRSSVSSGVEIQTDRRVHPALVLGPPGPDARRVGGVSSNSDVATFPVSSVGSRCCVRRAVKMHLRP